MARRLPGPAGRLQELFQEGRLAEATPEALGLEEAAVCSTGLATGAAGGLPHAVFTSRTWRQAQAAAVELGIAGGCARAWSLHTMAVHAL